VADGSHGVIRIGARTGYFHAGAINTMLTNGAAWLPDACLQDDPMDLTTLGLAVDVLT
jgi:hypothetical protein